MKKDMEYYIQVSGRIMKDNLDKRKSLTKKICDWYLDQDKEDICLIASGSSLNAAYAARPFLLKYSKFVFIVNIRRIKSQSEPQMIHMRFRHRILIQHLDRCLQTVAVLCLRIQINRHTAHDIS